MQDTISDPKTTSGAPAPRNENVILLRDRRRLAYAEYGDTQGRPVLFFHGFPGSRLEASMTDAVARQRGLRMIAPDRPGFGLSDFQPHRRITDWPGDMTQLADALGIERFAVAGISGGGPYALACAEAIPERLTAAAVLSGVGPMDSAAATHGMSRQNRILFRLSRISPVVVRVPFVVMEQTVRHFPDRIAAQMMKTMPPPDRAVMQDPAMQQMFKEDAVEALRHGTKGAALEGWLYTRPWGFRLEDIRMRVHLWQGGADVNVPIAMGREMAARIPDCDARFYEDEGHMLAITHMDEIIDALAS
jgi:pimeloyl-ACP methyl ester carboxylesterase